MVRYEKYVAELGSAYRYKNPEGKMKLRIAIF
jgi:hypothetical protein